MGTAWQMNQPPSPAKRSACNRTAQMLRRRCSRREERFICQTSEPFTCLENIFRHVDTRSFQSPDKRSVMIEVIREELSPSSQADVPCTSFCTCILLPFDLSGAPCQLYCILRGVRDAELPSQSVQAINLLPEPCDMIALIILACIAATLVNGHKII